MKANELMIGDWVQNPLGWKARVMFIKHTCVFKDECEYLFKIGISKNTFQNNLSESELSPIPLTPEILEKNGFKEYIPENHLETVYACQDVSKAVADELYALWPYQDGSFYLLLRVDGKDMVRMNVHYVHQLQHAFSLCEIEKEIEL